MKLLRRAYIQQEAEANCKDDWFHWSGFGCSLVPRNRDFYWYCKHLLSWYHLQTSGAELLRTKW
jgi:hypothetical protein